MASFSWALQQLRAGKRVCRQKWSKGAHLFLRPAVDERNAAIMLSSDNEIGQVWFGADCSILFNDWDWWEPKPKPKGKSQRVVLVNIAPDVLAEMLQLPAGAKIQRVLKWPPTEAGGYTELVSMVVEHPDLPEQPESGLMARFPQYARGSIPVAAKPGDTAVTFKPGPLTFVDWGTTAPLGGEG